MIMLAISGAVGAFLTWKAVQVVRTTIKMEKDAAAKSPVAWEKAGTSWKLKGLAFATAALGGYVAYGMAFATAGLLLLTASIAYFAAMAARAARAGVQELRGRAAQEPSVDFWHQETINQFDQQQRADAAYAAAAANA